MTISRDFAVAVRILFKARFLLIVAGFLLFVFLASMLSASFGGRQPAVVALDVGFSVVRILVPFMIIFMVQELLSREFDKRYFLNSLAYPKTRSSLFLGRFLAAFFLVLMVLFVLGIFQVCLIYFVEKTYPQATPVALGGVFWIVMTFFAVDFLVVTAFSAFLAVFASTPSFVLIGTLGFVLIARSYGSIIELISRSDGVVSNAEGYRSALGFLSYMLPDLGALDVRMIALYGKLEFLPSDWPWFVLSNFAYAAAMLSAAVWLLQRKRFV